MDTNIYKYLSEIRKNIQNQYFINSNFTFENKFIFNKYFEIIDKLESLYSDIYLLNHLRWNTKLLLQIPLPNIRKNDYIKDILINYAQIWCDLPNHPNIVTCYYYDLINEHPVLIKEYFEATTLKQWVNSQKTIKQILDIAIQLVRALTFLHKHNIIYKCLSLDTCLISNSNVVKLDNILFIDTIENILLNYRNQDFLKEFDPSNYIFINNNRAGIPEFMPPEAFQQSKLGFEADIYSFGMLIFELIAGQSPFILEGIPSNARWTVFQTVQTDGIPIAPKAFRNNCPDSLNDLIMKCLEKDHNKRKKHFESFKVIENELIRIYENITGEFYPRETYKENELIADKLNNQAVLFYDFDNKQVAIDLWEEAVDKYPEHLEANFNLGYYKWQNAELAGDDFYSQIKLLENKYKFNLEYTRLIEWILLERGDIDDIKQIQNSEFRVDHDQDLLNLLIDKNIPICSLIKKYSAKNPLDSAIFSYNGKYVAIGGWNEINIYDIEEDKEILHFYDDNLSVKSLIFSPNDKYIASGSMDDIIRVWDLQSGKLFRKLIGHSGDVYTIKFTPDGKYLVSGSEDGKIKIWDFVNDKEIKTINAHNDCIYAISISSDGKYIASGSMDKTIKIWDLSTGKNLNILVGHTSTVKTLTFTHNNKFIVSGSWDKTIRLWDWKNAKQIRIFAGHTLDVYSVSVDITDTFILSAGLDKTIRLWNLETGIEIRRFVGHSTTITSINFSPDGKYIISASEDHNSFLWQIENFYQNNWKNYHPFPVLSKPKNSIVTLDDTRKIKALLDQIRKFLTANMFERAYEAVREALNIPKYHKDQKLMTLLYTIAHNAIRSKCNKVWFYASIDYESMVNINFSQNSNYLSITESQKNVKFYDIDKKEIKDSLDNEVSWVHQTVISPDNRFYLTGRLEQIIKLWDIATKKEICKFIGHNLPIRSLTFSPNGKYIASGSIDKTIRLWSLETLNEKIKFVGHTAPVNSVRFSPNGLYIVSGSEDRTIRIWDINNGKEIIKLNGHTRAVTSVTFTPDSRFIVSGSEDKTIRIWNAKSGEEIKKIVAHNDNISVVIVSPNGRYIASVSLDNTIRIWEIDWEWDFSHEHISDDLLKPYLAIFKYLHKPIDTKNPLIHSGDAKITDDDLRKLQHLLADIGFGKIKLDYLKKIINMIE